MAVAMPGLGSSGLPSAGASPVKGSVTVPDTFSTEANYS